MRRKKWLLLGLEASAVGALLGLLIVVLIMHVTRPPLAFNAQVAAMETTLDGEVVKVLGEEVTTEETGLVQIRQRLEVRILTRGPYAGQVVEVTYDGMGPTLRDVQFHPGSRLMLMTRTLPDGQVRFGVAGPVRLPALIGITLIFVLLTLAIGRWRGVGALLGLVLSGILIGGFVLPQILAHRDPVEVTLLGMTFLLAVTLYLIQGWDLIAHTALWGMLLSLALTGLLAWGWTLITGLTGFGSEETLYLQSMGLGLPMRGLLLAGMIIGVAGVLDDVVLAQSTAVYELAAASPDLTWRELYRRGMKIGVAHLASMVNTLVLAYASAALPLMLLFWLYPEPWYMTLNREMIAEEIVRTLVGSVGLMVAVPLTTFIAALLSRFGQERAL